MKQVLKFKLEAVQSKIVERIESQVELKRELEETQELIM
jgi:hypothetical protein